MSWPLVVLAAVLGAAALLLAVVLDRRSRRRLLEPPDRTVPGLPADAAAPHYLSAEQASQPVAERTVPSSDDLDLDQALALEAGWADRRFAQDQVRAVLRDPVVVVVSAVGSVREALPLLEHTRGDRGLVLVAGEVEADTLETLAVNAVRGSLEVVVVQAGTETRHELVEALGCRPLDRAALQSGWAPADAFCLVTAWVSTDQTSWVWARLR
ncbi:MAG: hypothetical protein Q4G45_10775 [Actinomycetia bacterium]|nr:hypothetical protein [Actinomycetes bacterium]